MIAWIVKKMLAACKFFLARFRMYQIFRAKGYTVRNAMKYSGRIVRDSINA